MTENNFEIEVIKLKKQYFSSIVGTIINLLINIYIYFDFRYSNNVELPFVFWIILSLGILSIYFFYKSQKRITELKLKDPEAVNKILKDESLGSVAPPKKLMDIVLGIILFGLICLGIWVFLAATNRI